MPSERLDTAIGDVAPVFEPGVPPFERDAARGVAGDCAPTVAGATNVTVIVVPLGEIVGVAGVLGMVAGMVEADATEFDPLPSALVASTVQV